MIHLSDWPGRMEEESNDSTEPALLARLIRGWANWQPKKQIEGVRRTGLVNSLEQPQGKEEKMGTTLDRRKCRAGLKRRLILSRPNRRSEFVQKIVAAQMVQMYT